MIDFKKYDKELSFPKWLVNGSKSLLIFFFLLFFVQPLLLELGIINKFYIIDEIKILMFILISFALGVLIGFLLDKFKNKN